jgi:hypothetical protein
VSKFELAAFRPQKTKGRIVMLALALYSSGSLAITLLQDSISLGFGDQGRKLLVGFAVAVVVVIAFTIIKFQRRDKNPSRAFISVTSCKDEDTTPK